MSRYLEHLLMLAIVVISAIAMCGCDSLIPRAGTNGDDATTPDSTSRNYTEQFKALYEKAKAAGEQVPEDILEWAKADVKKIGTWDYKIVSFSSESEKEIADELKKLGSQRWECFWVEPIPGGKRFYMKKAVRSYLQMTGKASKLVTVPGSGE
jgi:hypothetical protein